MSSLPSYYAWQPSLEPRKDTVSIFLTRGVYRQGPNGGREFFQAVLAAAEIDAHLTAWGIEPFLTSYFARNEWEECWNARLLLTTKFRGTLTREINGVPIMTRPTGEFEPVPALPLRVLADFKSKRAAVECRDALQQRAAHAKWNDIHYERYLIRDVRAHQKQLLVDVITIDRSRLQELVPAAEQVMLVCQQLGGRIYASPVDERKA